MEPPTTIPLVILAGRDRSSERPDRAGYHDLGGFKAIETQIEGKPLIQVAVERFRATGLFDPIVIAGPAKIYEQLGLQERLIDTDKTFGANLGAAVETLITECAPPQIAITTSDIVPETEDLERVLGDYRAHLPLEWWMALHRVDDPDQLRSSAYKPRYRIVPHGEREPAAVLPGHLVIVNAMAARRRLIYKIFDLAYASRGKSVAYRRVYIVRRAIITLLGADLRRIFRGQTPVITASLLWHGFRLANALRRGDVEIGEMEDMARTMWATRQHRRRFPDLRGRFAVLPCRSLARDVDTEEEAMELTQKGTL